MLMMVSVIISPNGDMYLVAGTSTLEIVGSLKQQQKKSRWYTDFSVRLNCYFHCFIIISKQEEQYEQEKLKQLHIVFSMPFSYT